MVHFMIIVFKSCFVFHPLYFDSLHTDIFCGLRYLERFVAKDIQSRCRNLREMKDVFKELKVLGTKRKNCTSQINKDILETIFTSTSMFSSTILVTF